MAIGGEFTARLLTDSGIGAGMRVLDVGCGAGDVSLIAAGLVGAGGSVLGIDRDSAPLEAARERVAEAGLANVAFKRCDLNDLPADLGVFDAIVGRRVLMYLADPVGVVRGLIHHLRPGGLVAFHEHDATMVPASGRAMPLHFAAYNWAWETVRREGADPSVGFNLNETLTQAGLSVEQVRAEAIVQTPTQKHPVATIIRAMLPRIVEHGVATEGEIDIETLETRLDEERVRTDTTYVGDMMFGAWARKPA